MQQSNAAQRGLLASPRSHGTAADARGSPARHRPLLNWMRGPIVGFLVRRRLVLALLVVSALFGGVCAKLNAAGHLPVSGATSYIMIDDPDASIVDRNADQSDVKALQARTELDARLLTTAPVLASIARQAGIPAARLSGVADLTADAPIQFTQAGSEEHASQLQSSKAPFRLEAQANATEPLLTVYADAPTTATAIRLADAVAPGLQAFLRGVAGAQGVPVHGMAQLRQLGDARGGVTNSGSQMIIAGLTFLTAFALTFIALFLLALRPWRTAGAAPEPIRVSPAAAADWPRTSRALPWSIAALIAMFWLTPFDDIQLNVSAPINITLDRIVIPVVAIIWLVAFTGGPGARPRLRLSRVHVAIIVFLACAFLSTVLDAHYLNHTDELALSLKKLPLLASYIAVFVIVASSIRRSEVPAFMTYTLLLAVIVGLGVIYEYKFHTNLFVSIAGKVFTGPFRIVNGDATNASVLDSLGRRWVQGPTGYGVELVAILSIALAIALLRLLDARGRRQYVLYGLAILVLLYAMIATDRKSALIAPAAVFLTVAWFRRQRLLALAPLGLVLIIVLIALSPASLRNVLSQYTAPDASHVATVTARTANYDAVRPDLWSHLLLGRGQGSYAPPTDRIVDSDFILPLVETGVLGLVAFLMVPLSLISACGRTGSRRESRFSVPAVVGAAAGVCFLVVAALYSVMSLPHAPDVFFYVAALAVAAVGPADAIVAWRPARRRAWAREPRRRDHTGGRSGRDARAPGFAGQKSAPSRSVQ